MRILAACSLGGAGHWLPVAAFLRDAAARGDEVLVIAPPALEEMIERSGFVFTTGGAPPETEIAPIREQLATASGPEASVLGNHDLFGRLAATAMLPHVDATCRRWVPDLVVRDPCEYASAAVAGERSVPAAQVAISLAAVEWASLGVASPAIEAGRPGLTAEIAGSPYVSRFPERLDPSPFDATMRYRESPPSPTGAIPNWWGASDGPLVYVTLGTVLPHMTFAAERYRLVVRALAGVDARVLLTVGGVFDLSQLDPVPPNIHVEQWIDQHRILEHAALVVCHGGSGTVFGSIDAGVPLVVLPSFSDQFANGRLVERHGVGLTVEAAPGETGRRPLGESDVVRITNAIETVLGQATFSDRAGAIAEEISAAPSALEVIDRLAG